MLPDGAERHLEDWTIFFLNQTPFNTISPVLALEEHDSRNLSNGHGDDDHPELLYVLNLVRTKLDDTVERCVTVEYGRHILNLYESFVLNAVEVRL